MLLILIFSLTQLTCIGTSHSDTVKLKGGLIYKHEGQAQINQDFLIFKRSVDSSALKSVAQRLFDSTTLYEEYCNYLEEINNKGPQMIQSEDYQQAMDKNITVKYIATPLKYPLKDTMSVCARISARRVEIRDIYTYNAARTFATLHNIDQFEAGIIWNAPTKLPSWT